MAVYVAIRHPRVSQAVCVHANDLTKTHGAHQSAKTSCPTRKCRVKGFKRRTVVEEYTLADGASGPHGIATGPDGALWFTEMHGGRIGRITTEGEVSAYPLPTADARPAIIAAGPDGALWFAEHRGNNIGRILTDGSIDEYPLPTPEAGPFGITAGSDGAL